MTATVFIFIVSVGIITLEAYALNRGIDGKSLTAAIGALAFITGLLFPRGRK